MLAFLALVVFSGVVKYAERGMPWESDPKYGNEWVKSTMSKVRFYTETRWNQRQRVSSGVTIITNRAPLPQFVSSNRQLVHFHEAGPQVVGAWNLPVWHLQGKQDRHT